MAKIIKNDTINQEILIRYLETKSDFAFELRVLQKLKSHGLACSHGGQYLDPVSKKSREFDIRAQASAGRFLVKLAVECKNLQPHFPLLVLSVPRAEGENYHSIAVIEDHSLTGSVDGLILPRRTLNERARTVIMQGARSMYLKGQPVGKSTVQVGFNANKVGELLANDTEVHEKWGQCLASIDELIEELEHTEIPSWITGPLVAMALPIVVVPDGTLWETVYQEDGTRVEDPVQVDRISIYIGKRYFIPSRYISTPIVITHQEFMTETGINQFIQRHLLSETDMSLMLLGRDDAIQD